jgi:hypothetical protein
LGLFGFKDKEELNYLKMTPQRNYEYEKNENNLIDVLVPKFKNEFLKNLLVPRSRSPYIKANLDEFGSETWLLMDGENKVEFIADKLTEKFGDKIQPVIGRLTTFLTNLYKNDFISFKEIERK